MRLTAVNMLGISITSSPQKNILEYVKKYLEKATSDKTQKTGKYIKPLVIVTPNPEHVVYAQSHPEFKKMLNRADVALPDGIGIIKAGELLRIPIAGGRVSGVDMMKSLVMLSRELGARIGLIGGRDGVALESLECLKSAVAEESRGTYCLEGWATDGPELEMRNDKLEMRNDGKSIRLHDYAQKVYERTVRTKTQTVFIGLGAPKQESLMFYLTTHFTFEFPVVFMAVGGSMDIVSGRISRAPRALQSLGLEWLWRLMLEPWRIGRQMALIKFAWLVLKNKSSGNYKKQD